MIHDVMYVIYLIYVIYVIYEIYDTAMWPLFLKIPGAAKAPMAFRFLSRNLDIISRLRGPQEPGRTAGMDRTWWIYQNDSCRIICIYIYICSYGHFEQEHDESIQFGGNSVHWFSAKPFGNHTARGTVRCRAVRKTTMNSA